MGVIGGLFARAMLAARPELFNTAMVWLFGR
jgi:hypothetical protein